MTEPRLRFQVVTFTGDMLSDSTVGIYDAQTQARHDAELAVEALERGQAVTLVVRDPDEHDRILLAEAQYPPGWTVDSASTPDPPGTVGRDG